MSSFHHAFRAKAADTGGRLSFAAFMQLALLDPEHGYYARRNRERVGKAAGTDFYTSTNVGDGLFGELVAVATAKLLRERGLDPAAHTFVEIGAEQEGGVLSGLPHPFAAVRPLRLGERLSLSGPCVVFSNELFDAQPCRRLRRTEAGWVELGVEEDGAGGLRECELGLVSENWIPAEAPLGYVLDAPRAAGDLARDLAAQPWTGLFLAFDYGLPWAALASERPSGTMRAYHLHTQNQKLLDRPGEQDLTCHVCWDWIAEALKQAGCSGVELQSQEAFIVRHAGDYIGAALAREGGAFSARKQALMQLIHPVHMGQKFQVLRGWK